MSLYEEIIRTFENLNEYFCTCVDDVDQTIQKEKEWLNCIKHDIAEFEKTGILPQTITELTQSEPEKTSEKEQTKSIRTTQILSRSNSSNSSKENASISSNHRITRQTKNLISSNVQQEQHEFINNLHVKMERDSTLVKDYTNGSHSGIKIKEEMPPPKKVPLRNTRKKKVEDISNVVKTKLLPNHFKKPVNLDDSDVQIQKQNIDTVILEDTIIEQESEPIRQTRGRTKTIRKNQETTEENQTDNRKTRVTRTKQNKQKNELMSDACDDINLEESGSTRSLSKHRYSEQSKRARSGSCPGDEGSHRKPTKIQKSEEEETTEIADRIDHSDGPTSTPIATNEPPKQVLNDTLVIDKPTILNQTAVLQKHVELKEATTLNDIMTDDEDVIDSPIKPKQNKIKPIFSPYENSPVKKRVEDFEKLNTASNFSRLKKTTEEEIAKNTTSSAQKPREIPRLYRSPLVENKLKHLQTTFTSKTTNGTSTPVTVKYGSGVKTSASQKEFRERELRRRQKETEAIQKKEALILAQMEEKRKKREQKEAKVQQIKLSMEEKKQKQLEQLGKAKGERFKQILAEKEAKMQKQKEETAKKRAAVAKKAMEAKNMEVKVFIPPYLKYETPLLQTPDCYDSDDSSSKQVIKTPSWQKRPIINQMLQVVHYLEPYKKTFLLSGPRTPNLQEIFPTIEPSKLKRTSSAIWNKTEKSIFDDLIEEDDEDSL